MKSALLVFIFFVYFMQTSFTQGEEEVNIQQAAVDRLIRYAKIDTQSKEDSDRVPSTLKQFDLARVLLKELQELGINDARLDEEHCYIYATIPSNLPRERSARIPAVGFIAHMDVSPSVNGTDVHPVIHAGYQGGDIILSGDASQVISVRDNPHLLDHIGADIITTDGTSLLGADDKAGIAEIMTAAEYWKRHPEIKHGTIKIAFTPDEEVGNGTRFLDVAGFAADLAYTVDGGKTGEISDETFNAKTAIVTFSGKNTHPGYAKNIMINSIYAASYFISLFPEGMKPETTEDRAGFLHPYDFTGQEEQSRLKVLLRDFETPGMESKIRQLEEMTAKTRERFPKVEIHLDVTNSYNNMNTVLSQRPEIVQFAEEAMARAGVTPIRLPIRGGTDGSGLTFMGLPTPNLFAGMQNPHSKLEWISSKAMDKSVQTIVNIASIWAEKGAQE
jgi:tripeptide aminopeptidase